MIWPQATDYNAAVQNPQVCFSDDDLRRGQASGDLFGLPCPQSGNFADVYQILSGDGQSWAVKCFTRPVHGLHPRYQAISDHLRHRQRAFIVEFRYLEEGIRVRGQFFPIVKMRWVEGLRLNDFVRDHLHKPALLDRLAELWLRLARELRDAGLAHGDLQHGNVLLVPGSKSASLALKLIDYDGMFVPALANAPSGEVGHPNYQHPQRLREGTYHCEMDRFSHLLIYTALRCLRAGGAELWQRYDNQENMLFRDSDFLRPSESTLLRELWSLKDRDARDLVGHLLLASQRTMLTTPLLEELVDEKVVRPLSGREEGQVNALLAEGSPSPRRARTMLQSAPIAEGRRAASTVLEKEPTVDAPPIHRTPTPPPLPRMTTPEGRLGLETALQTRRDVAGRMDPVVSILSRPTFLAVLATIALASFLLVNVLVWSFARQPTPPITSHQPPRLLPIEDVTLEGGQQREISLSVERNDCSKPLTLHVDGLPAEIKARVLTLAPDRGSVALPLVAPMDFEQPPSDVFVSLWDGDQRLDEKHFRLSIHKVSRPAVATAAKEPPRIRLKRVPERLILQPGQKHSFSVALEREDYDGPVDIQLVGLPAHALAAPISVPPRVPFAPLAIETTAEVVPQQSSAKIIASVDGRIVDEKKIAVTVEKPALTPPPLEKKSPSAREEVSFETVDHLRLAGTLYPGSKDKSGACVLMLHDLHSDRNAPAWRRLAEALQAEGHTVLTFDFRGCGQSKHVTPDFWRFPVNQHLPAFVRGKPEEPIPQTINGGDLPAAYFPWLIHDIAAARFYLDRLHDNPDSTVNTYNLLIIGAGTGATLGSLWLASEGIRCDVDAKDKKAKPEWLKNRDIVAAVWLGIETSYKDREYPVMDWVDWAHRVQVDSTTLVPLDFVYGESNAQASRTVRQLIGGRDGADHNGDAHPIAGAAVSGLRLLESSVAEKQILQVAAERLKSHHFRPWERETRHWTSHRWYWGFPRPEGGHDFYLAKDLHDRLMKPVPINGFYVLFNWMLNPRPVKLDNAD